MTKEQLQVREFMVLFDQDAPSFPRLPGPTVSSLRVSLIQEELDELKLALLKDHSLVLAADALGDLMYVVLGTAVALGIDLEPVFQEIHFSNLTKLHIDEKGWRHVRKSAIGKVIKPPTYMPPNLSAIIERQMPTNIQLPPHATNISSNL